MAEEILTLGVELLNSADNGIEELLNKSNEFQIKANLIGDRLILTPFNDDCRDLIEDCLVELDRETLKIKLVYLNESDKNIIDSQGLSAAFYTELDDSDQSSDGTFNVNVLPDLVDYVMVNPDLVESERKVLMEEYYTNSLTDDQKPKDDEERTSGSDETNQDDGDKEASLSNPDLPDDEESLSDDDLDKDFGIDKLFNEVSYDPLFDKAQKKFELVANTELPDFDDLTHQRLQAAILAATKVLDDAKQQATTRIYERLDQAKKLALENINSSVIQDIEQRHDETLSVIDQNAENDIKNAVQSQKEKYDAEREDYVQKAIPAIRDEYDAKYLQNHLKNIEIMKSEILSGAEKTKSKENDHFDDYVEEVREKGINKSLDSVDIDDIIQDYSDVRTRELEQLLDQSRQLQVESSEREQALNEEVGNLKNSLQEVTSQRNLLQETKDNALAAEATANKAQIKGEYEDKLQLMREQSKADVLAYQQKIEAAKHELEVEKAKSEAMASQNQSTEAKLKEQELTLAKLQLQMQTPAFNMNMQQQPINQSVQQSNGSKSWWKNVVTLGIVALGLMGSAYGVGEHFSNRSSAAKAEAVASSIHPKVKSDSESSDTTSEDLKVGDTFPYRTSDGKAVTITVDSPHTGHYLSGDNKYHTVVF